MNGGRRVQGVSAVVIVMLLGVVITRAQAPSGADGPNVQAADAAYTQHDWAAAEKLYASLTEAKPENGRYWYRLAVCERANKRYAPALEAFRKAGELGAGKGLQKSLVDYELSSTYAAMGDSANALKLLKDAADGGFLQISRIENDAEWSGLRTDQQFLALAREVRHNASPCEGAEFSQFDFWVGDWDVVSTDTGVGGGTSHVSKEMGGCVVWENWTSASSPYFGKSYNTYNVNLKRWEQYWVDNFAGVMFFHGNLNDKVMDYWTDDVPQSDGQMLRRHLQFFNLAPGKVRQFSQGSNDGGKTWKVEYDLTYTKHTDVGSGPRPETSKSSVAHE